MKIPKRFMLGAHEIKVHIVTSKEMKRLDDAIKEGDEDEDEGIPWGLFVRGENAIFIQRVRIGFCPSQQLHTFWHEYYHAMFAALNSDLQEDEVFVDQCGLLTHQMHSTAKY